MGSVGDWLTLAFSPSVVRRGLAYAVVVGAILVAINHGDALLAGDVDTPRLLRIGLTLLVPYLVSTTSSVAALRDHRATACRAAAASPGEEVHR
jgi:hypothetical protein